MDERYEKIHNHRILFSRRKELRKNLTPQEKILWEHVRNKKFGCRFRRQHSVGPYVVDFYCAKAKLVVEVDGYHHAKKEERLYDERRTIFLNYLGLTVLRFWNDEVETNLEEVLEKILSYVTPPF